MTKKANPFAMINDAGDRYCYHCGKQIKRGVLMVVSGGKYPFHRACYKQAEKEAEKELKRNPSTDFFSADAVAGAKRVTKIRPVVDRSTGERGEIVGTAPGGYVKVKWRGRSKHSLIKRSELRRGNPNKSATALDRKLARLLEDFGYTVIGPYSEGEYIVSRPNVMGGGRNVKTYRSLARAVETLAPVISDDRFFKRLHRIMPNPGLMEIAGGLQALDYLSGKLKKKNPSTSTRTEVRSPTRTSTSTKAHTSGNVTVTGGAGAGANTTVNLINSKRKRNPSAREMSERFQGQSTGAVKEYYASDHAPRLDFSRAGKLVFLKLERGKQIRIPGAVVTIDPRTEKLWIAGSRAPLFNRKAKAKGELLDFGPISDICYLTAKKHIGNNKPYEYVHPFGEEGGTLPHLCVDHEGMPVLRGGSYKIKAAGIVD